MKSSSNSTSTAGDFRWVCYFILAVWILFYYIFSSATRFEQASNSQYKWITQLALNLITLTKTNHVFGSADATEFCYFVNNRSKCISAMYNVVALNWGHIDFYLIFSFIRMARIDQKQIKGRSKSYTGHKCFMFHSTLLSAIAI